MFDPNHPPSTPLPIAENLTLTHVTSEEEARQLDTFNMMIHGDDIKNLTYALIMHHPRTSQHDFLFVRDTRSGEIVSSLCLIPWEWNLADITLKAGEMGIVGTHPDYRRQGIVRELVRVFKQRLSDGGYHLSHIQGIPYYYRQFGYSYSLPLEGGWHHQFQHFPQSVDTPYRVRPAEAGDMPTLIALYDTASRDLDIHTRRDRSLWEYLFTHSKGSETEREFYVIVDQDGQIMAYFGIALNGFGNGLIVSEASKMSYNLALTALPFLGGLAKEREKDMVRYKLPSESDLVTVARSHGAEDTGTYAWQIHFPDVPHLLRELVPVLEKRLERSMFRGYSEDFAINTYKQAFILRFREGRIKEVTTARSADRSALRLPPEVLPVLFLGYRSLDQVRASYPDASATREGQLLTDILFPPLKSYIYTQY